MGRPFAIQQHQVWPQCLGNVLPHSRLRVPAAVLCRTSLQPHTWPGRLASRSTALLARFATSSCYALAACTPNQLMPDGLDGTESLPKVHCILSAAATEQCTCSCNPQHVGGLPALQSSACHIMLPHCRREPSSGTLAAWCTMFTQSLVAASATVSTTNSISCRLAAAGVACDSVPPLLLQPLVLPFSPAYCRILPVSSCGTLSKWPPLAGWSVPCHSSPASICQQLRHDPSPGLLAQAPTAL